MLAHEIKLETMEDILYYARLKLEAMEKEVNEQAEAETEAYYNMLDEYENNVTVEWKAVELKRDRKRYYVERADALEEAKEALKKAEEAFHFMFVDKEYFDKL